MPIYTLYSMMPITKQFLEELLSDDFRLWSFSEVLLHFME